MCAGAMAQGVAARLAALLAATSIATIATATAAASTPLATPNGTPAIAENAADTSPRLIDIANATNSTLVSALAALSCFAANECSAQCIDFGWDRGLCHAFQCHCVPKETAVSMVDVQDSALIEDRRQPPGLRAKLWFIFQVTVGAFAMSTTVVFLFWLYGNQSQKKLAEGQSHKKQF